MDPISAIRQMMAESKFNEAQMTVEMHLTALNEFPRVNILPIYLELLELQNKRLPEELIIETAELTIENDLNESIKWLNKLERENLSHNFLRIQILKIKMAERKGRIKELYTLICQLRMYLFEARVPAMIESLENLITKYFKNDFQLNLQGLALHLTLGDLTKAEVEARELICACVEKASIKGTSEKLLAIAEIINVQQEKKQLEIYRNYCKIAAEGLKEKKDYKKIVEMIIYFDDFKFQVLLLDMLSKLNMEELCIEYAHDIRSHKKYDFVYIEKYFGHLKKLFIVSKVIKGAPEKESLEVDYELEAPLAKREVQIIVPELINEEESLILGSLKYQPYTSDELLELAISFIHSRFLRAAREAANLAMKSADTDVQYLKGCYLKATCLFRLADYRAVLDLSLDALNKSVIQDDILSFLYLQAEAYTQMGLKQEAIVAFKKILSIDNGYRLSRQRLARLDEI